jgi:hypothetical protein
VVRAADSACECSFGAPARTRNAALARTLRLAGSAHAGGPAGPYEQWVDLATARRGNGDPRFDRVTQLEAVEVDAAPPPDPFDVPGHAFTDVSFVDDGRPFATDRAGLWINAHPQGAVVMAVMDGGPADQAGMRVGDVIAGVDGEPACGFAPAALRERLAQSPAGGRVRMGVRRGEARVEVALLLLRDLV